ncbi:hypothetical protein HDV00_008457 [Rhizophlyctis rosea]|nr:hypothetical protein HDV00_008457 [Rhizophlyctis rosea]
MSAESLDLNALKLESDDYAFEFDKELQDLLTTAYGLKETPATPTLTTSASPASTTSVAPAPFLSWYHTPTPSPTYVSQHQQLEHFTWPSPISDNSVETCPSPFQDSVTSDGCFSPLPSAIDPSVFSEHSRNYTQNGSHHYPHSFQFARSPSPASFSEDGSHGPLTPPPSPFHAEFRRPGVPPLDLHVIDEEDYPSSPLSTSSTISSPYPATPVTPTLPLPFSTSSTISKSHTSADGKKQKKRVWYCKLPGCTKQYGTGAGLRWHLKHFHKQQSKRAVNKKPLAFRCEECDKAYSTMAGLRYHRKTVAHMEVIGRVQMMPSGPGSGLIGVTA